MKRKLDRTLLDQLTTSELWQQKLKMDCLKQKVFMAVRNNSIDFYYKGGRLFNFDRNGFKTHLKYAAVLQSKGKDYLTEAELAGYKPTNNFLDSYHRIKENCANYSGLEALGVSGIYHKNNYLSDARVVVLDIEVSLKSDASERQQDRIDVLLLDKNTGLLQFVEAKHYTNTEIWSTTTPKVIGQLARYETQIAQKKHEIIDAYRNYIELLNTVFNLALPLPTGVEPKVTLLIFGFDDDQKKGRLKTLIKNNPKFKGVKCYTLGNINKVNTDTLWHAPLI